MKSDHAFVVSIGIVVPHDALLTEDGASWSLFARAYLDKPLDPRTEAAFQAG